MAVSVSRRASAARLMLPPASGGATGSVKVHFVLPFASPFRVEPKGIERAVRRACASLGVRVVAAALPDACAHVLIELPPSVSVGQAAGVVKRALTGALRAAEPGRAPPLLARGYFYRSVGWDWPKVKRWIEGRTAAAGDVSPGPRPAAGPDA